MPQLAGARAHSARQPHRLRAAPRPRAARRAALAAAATLAWLALSAPAPAGAHAQLEQSVPRSGAVLERQPDAVVFRFDESVEASFGAVRVFDAAGARVDAGEPFRPGGSAREIAVRLRDGLPRGAYTAAYRVVSADAHVVSGGLVFSLGHRSAPGAGAAALLDGQDGGAAADAALGAARALQFAAIAVALGALAFAAAVFARLSAPAVAAAAFARRQRRLVLAAAAAGALSGVAGIVAQGAVAAGVQPLAALRPGVVGDTLATRFGLVWALAVVAWAALGASAALALGSVGRRRGERRDGVRVPAPLLALCALPAASLVLVPGLSGHAASQSPRWLLLPSTAAHVAAMALWAGGIATLLLALPAAARALPAGPQRSRLLAAALGRFSPLAFAAVAVLAATGVVQAAAELGAAADLYATAFGRALLAKAALLLGLVALGALQRRRVLPRLRAAAADGAGATAAAASLRRVVRAEAALIAAALVATAALAAYAPAPPAAASDAAQPALLRARAPLGPLRLELAVAPGLTGVNELRATLRGADGAPARARELTLSATHAEAGVGPLAAPVERLGPGRYRGRVALAVPGAWIVRVAARVSDFDEHTTRVEVPVR